MGQTGRTLVWIVAIEAVLLALCVAFPGAGHSPVLYTQLPALLVVGLIDANVGSCIVCAPGAWVLGALVEIAMALSVIELVRWARRRTGR